MTNAEYFLELWDSLTRESSTIELLQFALFPPLLLYSLYSTYGFIYSRIHGTRVKGQIVSYPLRKPLLGFLDLSKIDNTLKYSSKPIVRYKLPNQKSVENQVDRMEINFSGSISLTENGKLRYFLATKNAHNTPPPGILIDLIVMRSGKIIVVGLLIPFLQGITATIVIATIVVLLLPDYMNRVQGVELPENFSWFWIKTIFLSYFAILTLCSLKDWLKLRSYFKQTPKPID